MTDYAVEKVWTDEMLFTVDAAAEAGVVGAEEIQSAIAEQDFGAFDEAYGSYADSLAEAGYDISAIYDEALGEKAEGVPDTVCITVCGYPAFPFLPRKVLKPQTAPEWLNGLLLDGIIGGVGAVLGFVPQMLVLFIFLAFLESCGYMARVAFVHGPYFPQIRSVRQVLHPHADRNRLRRSRHYGFPYH